MSEETPSSRSQTCSKEKSVPHTRIGKLNVSAYVDFDMHKAFKELAIRKKLTIGQLVEASLVLMMEENCEPVPKETLRRVANPGVKMGRPNKADATARAARIARTTIGD